jgi:hypothetical protein
MVSLVARGGDELPWEPEVRSFRRETTATSAPRQGFVPAPQSSDVESLSRTPEMRVDAGLASTNLLPLTIEHAERAFAFEDPIEHVERGKQQQ